jgi:chromosome segregation ATPase
MSGLSVGGLMVSSVPMPVPVPVPVPASAEPNKPPPVERPVMSDDRRTFDLSTVRERAGERDDIDVDSEVMTAIEERADDGELVLDAFADWHRECRAAHDSTAADVDGIEARFEALRSSLDPTDSDTTQVRARIDEFAAQFESMRAALSTAADRLDATPDAPESPAAVYEGAEQLRRAERVVHEVAHSCHHVEEGIEAFETWLDDPEARLEELGEEMAGFERYLDNTERLLDRLEAGDTGDIRPFGAWLSAYHLQRVMALVFEELRTDIDELETWLARQDGSYGDEVAALRSRLGSLEARHGTCSERLDAAAADIEDFAAKRAEVAESVDRFEAALADREPPVDWGDVEELVQSQFDELGLRIR